MTKIYFHRRKWISVNIEVAQKRAEGLQGTRDEVEKLEKSIVKNIKLKAIQYDCGWNVEHIRGCLKSLDRISKMHESDMKVLEGELKRRATLPSTIQQNHTKCAQVGR